MRIAVLGNSHVGAWKLGWNRLKDQRPDIDVTFFGAPGDGLRSLEVKGRALTTRDQRVRHHLKITAGTDKLQVRDYDLFCLVAMGLKSRAVEQLYAGYRAESHLARGGDYALVSDACFEAAARAAYGRDTPALSLAAKLASLTDRPIYLAPQPCPSEAALDDPDPRYDVMRLARASGDEAILGELYRRVISEMEARGPRLVLQPAATLASPMQSRRELSTGSARLIDSGAGHNDNDYNHMNADYGALVFGAFLLSAEARGDLPQFGKQAGRPIEVAAE